MLRFLLKGNRPEKYDRARAVGGGTFNTPVNIGRAGSGEGGPDGEIAISPERQAMLDRIRLMCLGAFPEAEKAAKESRAADPAATPCRINTSKVLIPDETQRGRP